MEELDPTVFEKAAEVLKKNKWTKNAYAKNRAGLPVDPTNETACKFCAAGAICNVTRANDVYTEQSSYLDFLSDNVLGGKPIPSWNDHASDKRVIIRALNKAAKLVREKQKPVTSPVEEKKSAIPGSIPAGTVYDFMGETFVTLEPATYEHHAKAYTGAKNVSVSTGYIGPCCFVVPGKIKF